MVRHFNYAAKKRIMADKDEHYILEMCDRLLGQYGLRQYRFPFLLGDPGKNGQCRSLPVDAYYKELNLVIEYRERQHTETVTFFDKRITASGIPRGEQRRLYDQRRRDLLKQQKIQLIELDYFLFPHKGSKRLLRVRDEDEAILKGKLSAYIMG